MRWWNGVALIERWASGQVYLWSSASPRVATTRDSQTSQHMESGKQACVQRAKQTHEDYESRLPRCTRYGSKASEVYKQGYFSESDGEVRTDSRHVTRMRNQKVKIYAYKERSRPLVWCICKSNKGSEGVTNTRYRILAL